MQDDPSQFDPAHVPDSWRHAPRPVARGFRRKTSGGDATAVWLGGVGAYVVSLVGCWVLFGGGAAVSLLLFSIGALIYFLPTLVAWSEDHPQIAALAALNIILGWTIIGWGAAMVWALIKKSR